MPDPIFRFDQAVQTLTALSQKSNCQTLCLRITVVQKRVHSFCELWPDERTVWLPGKDAPASQPDWQIAALGCAVEIAADGTDRFPLVARQAQTCFEAIGIASDGPDSHFPQLRFFGGAAFSLQPRDNSIWSAFRDARFILPRWQYATQSRDATLQLVIDAHEFHNSEGWKRELQKIFAWLEQTETLKMPVTESVSITHYSNGWETLVNDALQKINDGVLQKVVVSRVSHLQSKRPFSLQRVLERLETSYFDCIRFAVGSASDTFIGATPEQLIRVGDFGRRISADALAGSAERTGSSDAGAQTLQRSEKEHREFEFVIDNIESQLKSRGIRITSDRDIKIKSLKNLYHLHCPVTGIADPGVHILELVALLHPTPAVCGTPTEAAAHWLGANEHQSRGWYAGPVGWFDAKGDGCFAVGIRSALVKTDEAWLFAGAGIVEGSKAAVEFTETGAKLTPMLGALGAI